MDSFRYTRHFFLLLTLVCSVLAWQGPAFAQDSEAPAASSININSASAGEIAATLVGIGEKRAEAIVEFREENGPFESLDDLTEVTGVGETTVEKNASRISF